MDEYTVKEGSDDNGLQFFPLNSWHIICPDGIPFSKLLYSKEAAVDLCYALNKARLERIADGK